MPIDARVGFDQEVLPEWRHDPLTGRWVVIARDRAARPRAFPVTKREHATRVDCPFCLGQEEMTPVPVLIYRPPEAPDHGPPWWVRVVPNRYPAVRGWPTDHDGPGRDRPARSGNGHAASHTEPGHAPPHVAEPGRLNGPEGWNPAGALEEDLPDLPAPETLPGHGLHEVIVESPHHVVSSVDVPASHLHHVVWVYRERMRSLSLDPRIKYVQIFKNCGVGAGASLEHTHSQVLALPFVPPALTAEVEMNRRWFEREGACGYCMRLEKELQGGERIIAENDRYVSFCPYASRFPYEICLLPKTHHGHFERTPPEDLVDFAKILHETIARLEQVLKAPSYNYVLHSAPFDLEDERHYHWHMELFPRLTNMAGFEFGAGAFINPVSPEQAAEALRAARPETRWEASQTPWVPLGPMLWPGRE